MSFKPPDLGRGTTLTDVLAASFQNELLAERASELGRTGEKVARMINRLEQAPADLDELAREDLLAEAADAVWTYFIQREISGFRNHRDVIAFYRIPHSVLSRLGVVRPRRG